MTGEIAPTNNRQGTRPATEDQFLFGTEKKSGRVIVAFSSEVGTGFAWKENASKKEVFEAGKFDVSGLLRTMKKAYAGLYELSSTRDGAAGQGRPIPDKGCQDRPCSMR